VFKWAAASHALVHDASLIREFVDTFQSLRSVNMGSTDAARLKRRGSLAKILGRQALKQTCTRMLTTILSGSQIHSDWRKRAPHMRLKDSGLSATLVIRVLS
jgi:hypothetical protein